MQSPHAAVRRVLRKQTKRIMPRIDYEESRGGSMADVQLQNGYMPIANELTEAICRAKFTATELKVVLAVMRYTYGYSRKFAELSASFLASVTEIPKRSIERALSALTANKVIFSVSGGSRKDSRLLGMNKNYSDWNVENALKTCSNAVDKTLKSQSDVENLLKTHPETHTADTNDGSLKNPTADTDDGSYNATADTDDGRTTDTDDGHTKQEKQVTATTNMYTFSPLNPPTGEKTENGVQKRLPDVKNFSWLYTNCLDFSGETVTDLLSGLSFSREKWGELEETMGSKRMMEYYDKLRDGYINRGWRFKTDVMEIIEKWYKQDCVNEI